MGEDDIAIGTVRRRQVVQDDRIEQTDDVRHDHFDDRRGVEARGERATRDAPPHRIGERRPVLLRECGGMLAQLGVMGRGGPELHQHPPGVDGRGQTAIDHRHQLLPGVVELCRELLHRSDRDGGGARKGLDQHVLARAEIALQGADRHP